MKFSFSMQTDEPSHDDSVMGSENTTEANGENNIVVNTIVLFI